MSNLLARFGFLLARARAEDTLYEIHVEGKQKREREREKRIKSCRESKRQSLQRRPTLPVRVSLLEMTTMIDNTLLYPIFLS